MTELHELIEWIKRVNIPYQVYHDNITGEICVEIGQWYNCNTSSSAVVIAQSIEDQSKVDGYSSFYHTFVFNNDGRLLKSGSWE